MPDIKRTVNIVTEQRVIDKPSPQEGFPLRSWNIEIYLVNQNGENIPATVFEKVTYELHPSFGSRAKQVKKQSPFRIEEEGWGEFDMTILLTYIGRGGEHTLTHDLNFQNERYEAKHTLTFRNPKPDLLAALEASGPTENGARKSGADAGRKKARKEKNVDMEKLADGLQKLGEDDLLQVVQMIHDQKTPETYTKNDVENGEFHVDLYTLPDTLVKHLWDFTQARTDM